MCCSQHAQQSGLACTVLSTFKMIQFDSQTRGAAASCVSLLANQAVFDASKIKHHCKQLQLSVLSGSLMSTIETWSICTLLRVSAQMSQSAELGSGLRVAAIWHGTAMVHLYNKCSLQHQETPDSRFAW